MFGYQSYLFLSETHRIRRKKKEHHSLYLPNYLFAPPPPHGVPTELVIIHKDADRGIYILSMYVRYG